MEPTNDDVIIVDAQPDVIMINMTTALTQCMILTGQGCRRRMPELTTHFRPINLEWVRPETDRYSRRDINAGG